MRQFVGCCLRAGAKKEKEKIMTKILKKEEHIYHEDLSGSFSWKAADTNESIPAYGSAWEGKEYEFKTNNYTNKEN